MVDLFRPAWRKSSFSTGGGNCVEVAPLRDGWIGVRDSKCPEAGAMLVTRGGMGALLRGIKAGKFADRA